MIFQSWSVKNEIQTIPWPSVYVSLRVSVLVWRCSRAPQIKILKIQEGPTRVEHLHNMICDVHSSMLNTPRDYALWGYKSGSLSFAFVPRLRRTSSPLITSSAHFIKFNTIQDARATAVVDWSYLSYESDKVITTVEAPLYLT